MSIEPFGGQHTPVCDGCEVRLPGEMSWGDAVAAMQRERWRAQRSSIDGTYINLCPECQKEEKREQEKREQGQQVGEYVRTDRAATSVRCLQERKPGA